MTDTSELDRAIVENLLDLDDAAKRIEALGSRIWTQLCDTAEAWSSDNGWTGAFDPEDLWVSPAVWCPAGEAEAWFYPDKGPDDTGQGVGQEPYFWLSRYVGVGGGELCLWFGQKATGARKWKPLANEYAQRMSELGFRLSDSGNLYTVCTLDAKAVAAALADQQLEAAMLPIEQALDRAALAAPLFSELLADARRK